MNSVYGFLREFCFRGQNLLLCKILLFSDQKFQEEGEKSFHLSRGLLRNRIDVKWHSVGSTMTSIVGEVTQTYS